MKPTGCTLLLSIFSSTSLNVSDIYAPSSGELTVSMRHWYFSLCVGGCLVCRPDSHLHRVKNTVSSPDDGHIVARNTYRSWSKYTKKQCAPSWLHLEKIIQGCMVNRT